MSEPDNPHNNPQSEPGPDPTGKFKIKIKDSTNSRVGYLGVAWNPGAWAVIRTDYPADFVHDTDGTIRWWDHNGRDAGYLSATHWDGRYRVAGYGEHNAGAKWTFEELNSAPLSYRLKFEYPGMEPGYLTWRKDTNELYISGRGRTDPVVEVIKE